MHWEEAIDAITSAWFTAEQEFGEGQLSLDDCLIAVGVPRNKLTAYRAGEQAAMQATLEEGERNLLGLGFIKGGPLGMIPPSDKEGMKIRGGKWVTPEQAKTFDQEKHMIGQ